MGLRERLTGCNRGLHALRPALPSRKLHDVRALGRSLDAVLVCGRASLLLTRGLLLPLLNLLLPDGFLLPLLLNLLLAHHLLLALLLKLLLADGFLLAPSGILLLSPPHVLLLLPLPLLLLALPRIRLRKSGRADRQTDQDRKYGRSAPGHLRSAAVSGAKQDSGFCHRALKFKE